MLGTARRGARTHGPRECTEERCVESRIEVSWTCRPCEVGGQDAEVDAGDGPTCWNCGGPVVVTARPTVRTVSGPDTR